MDYRTLVFAVVTLVFLATSAGRLLFYTRTRFSKHDRCLFGRENPRFLQIGNALRGSFVSGCIGPLVLLVADDFGVSNTATGLSLTGM